MEIWAITYHWLFSCSVTVLPAIVTISYCFLQGFPLLCFLDAGGCRHCRDKASCQSGDWVDPDNIVMIFAGHSVALCSHHVVGKSLQYAAFWVSGGHTKFPSVTLKTYNGQKSLGHSYFKVYWSYSLSQEFSQSGAFYTIPTQGAWGTKVVTLQTVSAPILNDLGICCWVIYKQDAFW